MIHEKRLNAVINRHGEALLRALEDAPNHQGPIQLSLDGVVDVSNALAAIAMYRSTKRLERLTGALVALTGVLAILTATLVWEAFFK